MARTIAIELDGSRYRRSNSHIQMQWEAEKEIAELLREDGDMVVDGVRYELMSVAVGLSVALRYEVGTKTDGWTGALRGVRAVFDTVEGSDDLFVPGGERWRKATATFTWPETAGVAGTVLFRIARESDLESLRRFRLTGNNGFGVVELVPKGEDVKLSFECEISVERAIDTLRAMGNDEFSWTRERTYSLRSIKHYMVRGEFGFEDAAPVVEDAVVRLAKAHNAGKWRVKDLEHHSFDVIDGALIALANGVEDPAGEVLKGLIERGVGIGDVAEREE